MARKITKTIYMNGNKVSHAKNRSKKRWDVNIQVKRIFDTETGLYHRVRVSTSDLRTLNKMSLSAFMRKQGMKL